MLIERIALYPGRDDVTLTAYVQDTSRELPGSELRPAVLICPGGAYLGCSDREGEPVALAFAALGYHAFVLRYAVYHPQGFDPAAWAQGVEPREHCRFPKPMLDIAHAMLTLRRRAEEFHLDAERIAICGFSAGGHNCAMYSVYWDTPLVTDATGAAANELRPSACILGYPVTDFVAIGTRGADDPVVMGLSRLMNSVYFGTPEPDGESLRQASPARLSVKHAPPTFIWSTCQDSIVPISQSTDYAAALAQAGVPFEIHIFETGEHGLSLSTQATAKFAAQNMPEISVWLPLCASWLGKRFALAIPVHPPGEEPRT